MKPRILNELFQMKDASFREKEASFRGKKCSNRNHESDSVVVFRANYTRVSGTRRVLMKSLFTLNFIRK